MELALLAASVVARSAAGAFRMAATAAAFADAFREIFVVIVPVVFIERGLGFELDGGFALVNGSLGQRLQKLCGLLLGELARPEHRGNTGDFFAHELFSCSDREKEHARVNSLIQ